VGIDARLETGDGRVIAEVGDPLGLVNWLLEFADPASACLRFIDPYGQTVFNVAQIAQLKLELVGIAPGLTAERLERSKREYLAGAADWPARAQDDAAAYASSLCVDTLKEHRRKLVDLLSRGERVGPHHVVRFVGD